VIDQPLVNGSVTDTSDDKIACAHCRFARRVRMNPADLHKQLTCRFFPPQNVFTYTNQGPQLIGSGFPIVADVMWCFQFRRAEGLEVDSESPPELGVGNSEKLLS